MQGKLLIATTGITARAIYRQLKKDSDVIGFIDKNPQLENTLFDGKKVYSYKSLNDLNYDKIVIGGIWIEDIKTELFNQDVPKDKIYVYPDNLVSYFSNKRSIHLVYVLKVLIKLFDKLEINYSLFGSSLINTFRGKDLAESSDLDIFLLDSRISLLWKELKNSKELEGYQISKVLYREDKAFIKKGEFQKIVITSNSDKGIEEPMIIDINRSDLYKENYLIYYLDGYFFYYNKKMFLKDKFFDYQNVKIKIPYNPETFLKETYGNNWIEKPKKWSKYDYKNLIHKNEILK